MLNLLKIHQNPYEMDKDNWNMFIYVVCFISGWSVAGKSDIQMAVTTVFVVIRAAIAATVFVVISAATNTQVFSCNPINL